MREETQSHLPDPDGYQPTRILPGLVLTSVVAWAGIQSSEWIGQDLLGFEKSPVSGIMMAIIIGLILGNLLRLPGWLQPGIRFSLKTVLRVGIILLGIRLGLGDLLRVGILGLPLIVLCVTGALLLTHWIGSRLRLSGRLSALVAVGTSICGATAIVATGPTIDAREEEITYAVANITIFGLGAMFLYPYLAHWLFGGAETGIGLFLGTAIHETAQVTGSGLIYAQIYDAPHVLDVATVTKLVRNIFMIAAIPTMAYVYHHQLASSEGGGERFTGLRLLRLFPKFILGFVLFVIIRTIGDLTLQTHQAWGLWNAAQWSQITGGVQHGAELCLTIAMGGVGLGTSIRQLRGLGIRPFYVGLAAAVAVGLLSAAGIGVLRLLGLVG